MPIAGGSLVVFAPCSRGLVIAADQQTNDPESGRLDRLEVKIHTACGPDDGARIVFCTVGGTFFYDEKSGAREWGAAETVKEVFAETEWKPGSGAFPGRAVEKRLRESFREYAARERDPASRALFESHASRLWFELHFLILNEKGEVVYKLLIVRAVAAAEWDMRWHKKEIDLTRPVLRRAGSDDAWVFALTQYGRKESPLYVDPRLEALERLTFLPAFALFAGLTDATADQLSPDDAERFALELIRVTSDTLERVRWHKDRRVQPSDVGADAVTGLLDRERGFSWRTPPLPGAAAT